MKKCVMSILCFMQHESIVKKTPIGAFCNTTMLHQAATCLKLQKYVYFIVMISEVCLWPCKSVIRELPLTEQTATQTRM